MNHKIYFQRCVLPDLFLSLLFTTFVSCSWTANSSSSNNSKFPNESTLGILFHRTLEKKINIIYLFFIIYKKLVFNFISTLELHRVVAQLIKCYQLIYILIYDR